MNEYNNDDTLSKPEFTREEVGRMLRLGLIGALGVGVLLGYVFFHR